MMLLSAEITLLLVFRPGFGQGSAPGQSTTVAQHLVSYAIQLEERIFIQRSYPTFLRPFIRRFSHKTRSLKSIISSMKQVIIPEIRRRIAQKRAGEEEEDQDVFYLDVMIELSMKEGHLSRDGHDADPQFLDKMANHLLFICHEMISPLWMVSAMLLFELWSRPEYASPLRRELESALDLTGGQWCLDMFKHTPVLESFTKETLRLNPPSARELIHVHNRCSFVRLTILKSSSHERSPSPETLGSPFVRAQVPPGGQDWLPAGAMGPARPRQLPRSGYV